MGAFALTLSSLGARPSPHLPVQLLHQHGADVVAAVLDFHKEYEVAAFDDLQRENFQNRLL